MFLHSSSICEVRHWCCIRRPGSQSLFQSIPKVYDRIELRSGLCVGQSGSSKPNSSNHVCMDLALCTGSSHAGTEKHLLQTVPTSWKHSIVQKFLVCWSIKKIFFTRTRWPSPTEKQHHTIIPLYSWHNAVMCRNVLLAFAKPRLML